MLSWMADESQPDSDTQTDVSTGVISSIQIVSCIGDAPARHKKQDGKCSQATYPKTPDEVLLSFL